MEPIFASHPDRRRIDVRGLSKQFVLHLQSGLVLPILDDITLQVDAGECVVLHAPSGAGKSTLLRCLYGNYRASSGSVRIRHADGWTDLAAAPAREVHALRQSVLGVVTQFLRVIPLVSSFDLVMQPLLARGVATDEARSRAADMLRALGIGERLWTVPPATFSGGEQQRINLARTLVCGHDILLLDEPTASLDEANRDIVVELIDQARCRGAAIVGIFHDPLVRESLATRVFPIPRPQTSDGMPVRADQIGERNTDTGERIGHGLPV